jgi:hypothetical protein
MVIKKRMEKMAMGDEGRYLSRGYSTTSLTEMRTVTRYKNVFRIIQDSLEEILEYDNGEYNLPYYITEEEVLEVEYAIVKDGSQEWDKFKKCWEEKVLDIYPIQDPFVNGWVKSEFDLGESEAYQQAIQEKLSSLDIPYTVSVRFFSSYEMIDVSITGKPSGL